MDTRAIIQAIDHTNLDACATEEEILAFAAAAQGTGIASLCVQPWGKPTTVQIGTPPGKCCAKAFT